MRFVETAEQTKSRIAKIVGMQAETTRSMISLRDTPINPRIGEVAFRERFEYVVAVGRRMAHGSVRSW